MKIDIKPEPDFARIRKTLLLEGKPDRPPLGEFLIDGTIKEAILGRPLLSAADEVEFWIKAGYDYVHVRPHYNLQVVDHHDESIEGKGVIQTWEDLRSSKWPWQDLDANVDYSQLHEVRKHLPKGMKIILSTGDIFTRVWMHMGFTHFCFALFDEPELVSELMRQHGEAMLEINRRSVEILGDSLGAIWYTDDIAFGSGLMVQPEFFRAELFPWMKKIGDLARELDVPYLYHTDGNLWAVFDDFADIGINAIHPLEPNSMDAVEVKEKVGNRFCLVGNIDVDLLSRGTVEEVRTVVRERIEKLGYNGGYCVGSSNTIPPYVKVENYIAMIEETMRGYL
jgi:uroporphyrinogen decarboxylase